MNDHRTLKIILLTFMTIFGVYVYNYQGPLNKKEDLSPVVRKFQVGDCIQYQPEHVEIWDTPFSIKIILSLGNYSYRVAYFTRNIDTNSTNKIEFYEEEYYQKVSCNSQE